MFVKATWWRPNRSSNREHRYIGWLTHVESAPLPVSLKSSKTKRKGGARFQHALAAPNHAHRGRIGVGTDPQTYLLSPTTRCGMAHSERTAYHLDNMTPTLIGVVIGAVATLLGSALTLWFNKQQRERERQMQLRRDVYLEVASGLATTLDYMQQNGRADIPIGKVNPPPTAGWMFKAYLVANTDTLIALTRAGAGIAAAALDMFSHRLSVAQVDDDITLARSKIESIRQLQEQMRIDARALESQAPSELVVRRLESIAQQYELVMNELHEETSRLEQLTGEHGRRLRTLLDHFMRINLQVQGPVRAALLAARAELELPIDQERFRAATADIDADMVQKVNQLANYIDGGEGPPVSAIE